MKSSWKTSLAGVAAILTGLLALVHAGQSGTITADTLTTAIAGFTTGIGLLFARDHDVSSEEAGATPAQKSAVQASADTAASAPAPATPTTPVTPKTP